MRTTATEQAQRIRYARQLLEQTDCSTDVVEQLASEYNVSTRQARRYVKTAASAPEFTYKPRKRRQGLKTSAPIGKCYVVHHLQTGLYKIGCTQRWEVRKALLRVNKASTVVFIAETNKFRQHEKQLHAALAAYRLPASEWFFCTKEQLEAVLAEIV